MKSWRLLLGRWATFPVVLVMTLVLPVRIFAGSEDAARVLEKRCITCHGNEVREAGIDLTPLLHVENSSYGDYTNLWIRVERMVGSGKMPPDEAEPLGDEEKKSVLAWFRESFVLRNGRKHIGPTPLRRLTRYELENTLEDVLSIRLRPPYRDEIADEVERSLLASLVPSDIPGESGFDNDAIRMESLKPPLKEIAEAVHRALLRFSEDPVAIRTVFERDDLPVQATEDEVRSLIAAFVLRSCRCEQPRGQELEQIYFELYQRHRRESADSRESLLHVFETILVSPEFLYRMEVSQDRDVPYPVTGVELATRLSFFLWSTAPDKELMQLGRSGSLLKEDVLKQQIARMLSSPRRISLSENFAGQWLGFGDLLSNRDYFRNERWNRETYDEILFFFDELIKSDRSVLDLVQSDWIYRRASVLSSRRHGYERVEEGAVRNVNADILSDRQSTSTNKKLRYDPPVLVKVKDEREGGIITSTAVMRVTASKSRTSPIRRGVWVLKTILGRTLEPPPDIPSLEDAREALAVKENPSVAEIIQQHVSRPECISCHKTIDPLGLGLENFSPLGEWRTRYPDKAPVISSGIMPDGREFRTPQELKLLLLETHRDEIARNFVNRMLSYALGRKIQPFDRMALEKIVASARADGYRINTVIEQIVLSEPFRSRQDR